MSKYIDAEKLIAEIEKRQEARQDRRDSASWENEYWPEGEFCTRDDEDDAILSIITSLQQEQQTDEQVVVITESHGNANVEWDCRSLDDVIALLKSAESFISDKQVEKLRGPGCGPDYNTMEGRYSKPRKFQQEQPEQQNGKFVFPKFLYARTTDNKTIDVSYAPQSMEAIEYVRNDFVEQERPDNEDIDKVAQELYEHLYELKRRNNVPTNLYDKQEIIDLWKAGIEYGRNHPKQEQPKVDLEKELENFARQYPMEHSGSYRNLMTLARHFFELGKIARKEEGK